MQTLWNSRDTLPAYPPLREDLHADAAVVGGGMAGILTAYALHTRGLRVVLLEGSRLASGVTAHTTAKITAQHGRFCERLVHDFASTAASRTKAPSSMPRRMAPPLRASWNMPCPSAHPRGW